LIMSAPAGLVAAKKRKTAIRASFSIENCPSVA
jgi:hypothetical protein